MTEPVEPERLTTIEQKLLDEARQQHAELCYWEQLLGRLRAAQALFDGLLAVCRARDRGEPYWMLSVRRAQARIDAQRAGHSRARDQAGESLES